MTEQEAAERLCAVLNEIKAAGHNPSPGYDGHGIYVGDQFLCQTYMAVSGWGDWEVEPQ